ncbi:MAG: hypothetical protein QNJ09_03215 [Paracoccaceae bacterium]|nr:hypothetical protein [Paracoccaceae bacterium]
MAVLAGLVLPAALAWGLIWIAGVGMEGWLRMQILFVLYALAAAPIPAFFLLPLLWALALALVPTGCAGLASVVGLAALMAVVAAHVLLHGDLTTEALWMVPKIALAGAIQGTVAWGFFWAILLRRSSSGTRRALG